MTESTAQAGLDPIESAALAGKREAWNRLWVTLAGVAFVLVVSRFPLPIFKLELVRHVPSFRPATFGLFSLGLQPFIASFVLIEMIALAAPRLRPLRDDGGAGRARLTSWSIKLGLAFALIQGVGIARYVQSVGVLPKGWPDIVYVAAVLAFGTLVLAFLASTITRAGLGNGFWFSWPPRGLSSSSNGSKAANWKRRTGRRSPSRRWL